MHPSEDLVSPRLPYTLLPNPPTLVARDMQARNRSNHYQGPATSNLP